MKSLRIKCHKNPPRAKLATKIIYSRYFRSKKYLFIYLFIYLFKESTCKKHKKCIQSSK
jgi:hypothetical protein